MIDRSDTYDELRAKHPVFAYDRFEVLDHSSRFEFRFHYSMEPSIRFHPTLTIEKPAEGIRLDPQLVENLAFHLGLIEMVSYWKASCSPRITVRAGKLNESQLTWWKRLFFHGLGEFFYVNGLHPNIDGFVTIDCSGPQFHSRSVDLHSRNLIPIGGGKDSLVTLDLLGKSRDKNRLFFLNPTKAQWDSATVSGYERPQIVVSERKLYPALLELNGKGYLNGHTPFSALLGFVAITAAAIHGCDKVLLSNEASADESTVPGTLINHQWSKSWMFEEMLRVYVQEWIVPEIEYTSVLRNWNELQIAERFSSEKNRSARRVFRSCNVGQKTDSWCAKCPKCLFVNIILAPFVPREEIREIFGGAEPLDNPELTAVFDQLIGVTPVKPFECVGSVGEIRVALSMTARQKDPPSLVGMFAQKYEDLLQSQEQINRLLERESG